MKIEESKCHFQRNNTKNHAYKVPQQKENSGKTKVLILGGTGEMGQWFTHFFKEKGYEVTVWGKGSKIEIARKLEVPFALDLESTISESDI